MNSRMQGGVVRVVLAVLVWGLVPPLPMHAEAETITTRTRVTLGSVRFYDCAQEYIELRGDYQTVFHVTFDASGGTHVVSQHNAQGITGTGRTSGTTYRAVEGGGDGPRTTNIFGAPGFEYTDVDRFLLIGEGQAPDLRVQVTQHVTYSPSIGFTVQLINTTSTCR